MNDPEYDDDLAQAKAWLSLDPREQANRVAEITKRSAQRQAAKSYADINSQLEAVSFAPLHECSDCSDPLYEASRSPVYGICRYCLERQTAIRKQRQAEMDAEHQRSLAAKERMALPLRIVLCLLGLALVVLAAWGLAWGIDQGSYWLGWMSYK